MGDKSAISWTDATWNPWQGCHKVSAGCKHCYMFREKRRYGQEPNVVVRSKPQTFNMPLRLKEPQRVFTCSWSDWFIEEADPWRDEAWAIIERTPHLTYQIVTKRIERAPGRLPWGDDEPWPNVWLIVSAENQAAADERIPKLLLLNAAVRGVSYEPALAPIDFTRIPWGWRYPLGAAREQVYTDALRPRLWFYDEGDVEQPRLDWVIAGAESGSDRVFDEQWARTTRDACQAAGVAFFYKQNVVDGQKIERPLLDGRTWLEFPR